AWRAQGHVQNGSVLRNVEFLAAKHRVDPCPQAGLFRQLQEKFQGLVGDAILRVVEDNPDSFGYHPLASRGIIREKLSDMHGPDRMIMRFEGLPGRAIRE